MRTEAAREEIGGPQRDRSTRIRALAEHPLGPGLLFLFAAAEASVFPAPTEALLAALGVLRPRRAWLLGGVTIAGGLVGALAAYAMGAAFYEGLALPLLEWYGLLPRVETLGALYARNLFGALATSGFTPIPYMLYTLSAGAFEVPLGTFLLGALVGRTAKYLLIAAAARWLGPPLRAMARRSLPLLAGAMLLGGLLALWLFSR